MDPASLDDTIRKFLREDIGTGDITSEPIFTKDQTGEAVFVAQHSFIVVGMGQVAARVFDLQNHEIKSYPVEDGKLANKGDILLRVNGPILDLLKAERLALNLVQRLCGIATYTYKFVKAVEGLPVKIVDTRKTTPGLRMLEKYAVRIGGGHNHRYNLAAAVLIKDNHIAACGSISEAVRRIRKHVAPSMKIEVEAENIAQVEECLECGVETIMLDNMEIPLMKQAVKLINGRALVEASGGVKLSNVRKIAETGVDIISVGALTHSVAGCDISMRMI
ncbi:MAG: carboxylating nicotinate-nucleotide diphosphorylase [Proteobacteria bacterium]|nr:carboxylating nicotinate-nucleotide diphosphorylase [Pseudomonadota bacterium]MBU1714745.1 carboxylating nicotinate-nucleotide diphosphorylase [Pseudomonadota bacterium]